MCKSPASLYKRHTRTQKRRACMDMHRQSFHTGAFTAAVWMNEKAEVETTTGALGTTHQANGGGFFLHTVIINPATSRMAQKNNIPAFGPDARRILRAGMARGWPDWGLGRPREEGETT